MSQYYKPLLRDNASEGRVNRTKNLYDPESTGTFRLSRSGIKKPDKLLLARNESAKDILKEIGPISRKDYKYYEQLQLD